MNAHKERCMHWWTFFAA